MVALDPDATCSEWDALARRLGATPFVRPRWVLAWHASFGNGRLVLWGAFREGRLVGVLPLQSRLGALSSPTNAHTPCFEVLAEDDQVVEQLLVTVTRRARGELALSSVDETTARMVVSAAERTGCSFHTKVIANSPYLPVHGSSEAYFASRSRRFKREIERRRRSLDELGEVSTVVTSRYDDESFAELLRVEGSGWKARNGTALASDPAVERFYREVARWASDEGWLRLSLLCVDGTAIAADLSMVAGGRLYGLKTGYDERYSAQMPGIHLTTALVARAFDSEEVESFEFLGTDSSYKRRWTSSVRPRLRVHVFPSGPRGRLFRAVQVHVRPTASAGAAWWRGRSGRRRVPQGHAPVSGRRGVVRLSRRR